MSIGTAVAWCSGIARAVGVSTLVVSAAGCGTVDDGQPTQSESATAGTATGQGLRGEYFDNRDLTNSRLVRTDRTVNFRWDSGSPDPSIGPDTFSARWTGSVVPRYSETYTFYTRSDDGIRLWVNGQQIIDNWTNHPTTEDRGTITLVAGQRYDIKLEFYENDGGAVARLLWSSPSQAKQVIPQSQLFLPGTPVPSDDAGTPVTDSGTTPTDAGTPVTDAGTPVTDAGTPVTDAGTPVTDAGTPTGGSLSLPRIPWEGGPAYYQRFAKANAAGWSSPNFFPISVFLGKPEHAPALKALGINTYMGAEHDGSAISTITGTGMFVMAQDEWTRTELGNDGRVVSWLVSDECDMGLGCTGDDQWANLADQTSKVNRLRSYNDGRFMFANYGNGLLHTWWALDTMDELMQIVDVACVDKYMYTSPHIWGIVPDSPYWPRGATVASSAAYGWLADQMVRYNAPNAMHPNWVFVESARPYLDEAGSRVITPDQLEGAVWSAIIHEARGIAYFQHSNDPTCSGYALIDCDQARRDRTRAVNAKIASLAPVINTQSYQYNFNNGTNTMLKTYNGSAYIFADIGLLQSPGTKTFVLPPGVTGTTVTVVGENRTIAVTNRSFTDNFAAEYSHHVYSIRL